MRSSLDTRARAERAGLTKAENAAARTEHLLCIEQSAPPLLLVRGCASRALFHGHSLRRPRAAGLLMASCGPNGCRLPREDACCRSCRSGGIWQRDACGGAFRSKVHLGQRERRVATKEGKRRPKGPGAEICNARVFGFSSSIRHASSDTSWNVSQPWFRAASSASRM